MIRDQQNCTDYNLIFSSLLLHSSLVLIVGFSSLMCRASSVSRNASPRADECKMSMSSSVRVVSQSVRCCFIGPARCWCSLKRAWRCRVVSPTQQAWQLGHVILYTTPLFSIFSTGGFNEGRTVYSFRRVMTTVHGSLHQ